MARMRVPYSGEVGARLPRVPARGTKVYRLYDDWGVLLYVGVTCRQTLSERFNAHRRSARWWPLVAALEVETYERNHEALAAEVAAIRAEIPVYNRRSAVPV